MAYAGSASDCRLGHAADRSLRLDHGHLGGGRRAPCAPRAGARRHRPTVVVGGRLQRHRSHRTYSTPPTRSIFRSACRCWCGCTAADVIHSFWVPQLAGKTDTIPGQTNLSWLAGGSTRPLSWPMHGILRRSARAHGIRGGRRAASGLRPMDRAHSCRRPPLQSRRQRRVAWPSSSIAAACATAFAAPQRAPSARRI